MSASTMDARRKLYSLAENGGNWRLKGLYLAELPKTEFSPKQLARAWPTPAKPSSYRFLSDEQQNHIDYAPERAIMLEKGSEEYRQLSSATKNGDWQDGFDDEVKTISADRLVKRCLAFGETTEEFDTLWREQLMDTVIEGARKEKIARDAGAVTNVDTRKGDHPRGQDAAFAREVGEGGAILDDREDTDTVSWDTTKFGEGARATEELIDHSLVDEIERQVDWLGRQCENSLNRVWLTELIDNAGNNVDTSAQDNRDVDSVLEGIMEVELDDFSPNAMVFHTRYGRTLLSSNNILKAQQYGDDAPIRDRVAFPMLGLQGYKASPGVYDPDGSATWDFASTDDIGAIVYDEELITTYIYRDIEVKDYSDPIRDLEGVNARIQCDSSYKQPDSAATLSY